jgi:peptide deformylase
MAMKIVQVGEPVLRQRARALSKDEICSRQIQDLIASMRETMHAAPGVGLAAPQVGISLQLAVIEDKAKYMKDIPPEVVKERERVPVPFHVIVNPKLTMGSEQAESFEGCLSLPGFTAVVPRARAVRVECLDHNGKPKVIEASGWYARILQHEIDHLYGAIYIDRMCSETFSTLDNHASFWKDKSVAETRRLLARAE